MCRKAEWLRKGAMIPYLIRNQLGLICQHIRQLFQIANNHHIFRAGKGKDAGCQVHLGCLVNNKIVVDMIQGKCPFNGVSRA